MGGFTACKILGADKEGESEEEKEEALLLFGGG